MAAGPWRSAVPLSWPAVGGKGSPGRRPRRPSPTVGAGAAPSSSACGAFGASIHRSRTEGGSAGATGGAAGNHHEAPSPAPPVAAPGRGHARRRRLGGDSARRTRRGATLVQPRRWWHPVRLAAQRPGGRLPAAACRRVRRAAATGARVVCQPRLAPAAGTRLVRQPRLAPAAWGRIALPTRPRRTLGRLGLSPLPLLPRLVSPLGYLELVSARRCLGLVSPLGLVGLRRLRSGRDLWRGNQPSARLLRLSLLRLPLRASLSPAARLLPACRRRDLRCRRCDLPLAGTCDAGRRLQLPNAKRRRLGTRRRLRAADRGAQPVGSGGGCRSARAPTTPAAA